MKSLDVVYMPVFFFNSSIFSLALVFDMSAFGGSSPACLAMTAMYPVLDTVSKLLN